MKDLESYASADASITFSAEHFPVVLVTWFGTPTEAVIDAYIDWLFRVIARARAEQTKFVIIGDTTGITDRLGPPLRRYMANALDRFEAEGGDRLLGILTIIDRAVMRAVITMTLFLTRRQLSMTPVKSMEEAVPRAFALLDLSGIERPPKLDAKTYRRPDHPLGS